MSEGQRFEFMPLSQWRERQVNRQFKRKTMSKYKMKGIMFSTEMVRAIRENRKTMFRIPVERPGRICGAPAVSSYMGTDYREVGFIVTDRNGRASTLWRKNPLGCEGAVFYVAESWFSQVSMNISFPVSARNGYGYAADILNPIKGHDKFNPAETMPKEAARIFLRVVKARVERLQKISRAACKAEGVEPQPHRCPGLSDKWEPEKPWCDKDGDGISDCYKCAFVWIWKYAHKENETWESNPWVWVIEFERISKDEALEWEAAQ